MANIVLTYIGPSGHSDFVATVQRLSDGFYSPAGGSSFSNSLTFAQKQILLTEQTNDNGKYRATADGTSWVDDEYNFCVLTSGNQLNLASTNFWMNNGIECGPSGNRGVIWNAQISTYQQAGGFGSGVNKLVQDIYFSDIKLVNNAAVPNNEWSTTWFKNNGPVASGGVTDAAISVYSGTDGSALFTNKVMNWAGPFINVLSYIENTSMAVSGVNYLVSISGTIDGGMRTWLGIKGLDSL